MFIAVPLPMLFPEFLKIDISDLTALLGGIALGPMAGVTIAFFKNLLQFITGMSTTGGVGELCWRWEEVDGGAFVNPAHKAYLASSKTEVPDEVLLGDIITAICPMAADQSHTDATYNLAGQRVDKAYPSIVIRNGKKVWRR